MKEYICNIILLFFIYSFLGWIIEVIYTRVTEKKWINRGFLIGPICPIYGCGCILLLYILKKYENDVFVVFLGSIFICSVLEYYTSYFLEKIFNARWWDYSQFKFNINGRICLETMLPFGIAGTVVVCYINPVVFNLMYKIPEVFRIIVIIILLIIFIIDNIVSFSVISKIKLSLNNITADNTEEIKKKIKNIFLSKSYVYRRILKAFPHLFAKTINFVTLEKIRKRNKDKKKRDSK